MVDDWQGYRDRSFESDFVLASWKSWIISGIGIVAVMALILSILLTYRLRALSSSLTLLSLSNKVHALPTVTELNFYTTTTTSLCNHNFTVSTELICDIVIMALLAALVFLFIFLMYRQRHLFKFDLYVYIGNQSRCHSIWVHSFWLEPALYIFKCFRRREGLMLSCRLVPAVRARMCVYVLCVYIHRYLILILLVFL